MRNMRVQVGIVILFCVSCVSVKAQKNNPLINSYELLTRGIALADSNQFDQAGALYEKITRNDTSYALALYEDAVSRVSGGEDSLGIILCRKGLDQHTDYDPDFYKLIATALIDQGKNDDAIKLLKQEAIPKYSRIYLLQYSLGLAYYKAHQYDSAIAAFKRSLDLNMYHASSHYYLGKCCLEQGRMILAMLSLQFYLILEPSTTRSFSTVQLVEQVAENKYDYNSSTKVDPSKYNDDAFSDLELLIQSKIALKEDYKSKTKISYNITKQLQLFMEKLTYTPNTNNYWMDTYVPFFVELQQKDLFEPYAYYIMSSVNDDALQKDIAKEKKKIEEFTTWADDKISTSRKTREINIGGEKKTVTCYYYNNHVLQAMGQENKQGKAFGDWTIYNENNGSLAAKGAFNDNGDRIGQWEWYYADGTLKERTNYKDGKRDGLSETWYSNGAQKGKFNYQDDKLNGDVSEFTSSGTPSSFGKYKDDKPMGTLMIYYEDGKQHFVVNYTDNGLEGEQKEYFSDGQLQLSSIYKNGKKNGVLTDYWPNGKIQDQGSYKDDEISGPWKYYYEDGSLHKEGAFTDDGKLTGPWTIYFRNGKKEEELTYNKSGELNGSYIMYDDDGVKYGELDYKNDNIDKYTYTDKSGKVLSEGKASNRRFKIQTYYANGVMENEGETYETQKDGVWKYYSIGGNLTLTESYKAGKLDGPKVEFYPSGKVKDSVNYTDDNSNGYYLAYNENGTLKSEGWYVDGKAEGDWFYYNSKGTMTSRRYYLNGDKHGYSDFYDVNGRLSEEQFNHELGYVDKIWLYDTTGTQAIYTYSSDKGNGTYKSTYSNGQTRLERTYMAGLVEGHQKTYFFNGKVWAEGDFVLGNRQGAFNVYYENGKPESEYKYDMGNVIGKATRYFENGNIKTVDNYLSDQEDGPFKEYYPSGHIYREGQSTDGESQGQYNYYFEDSSLICTRWYKDGYPMSYSYLGKDGKMVPTIQMNQSSGEVKCFYPNGNKSLECTYVHGWLNGKRTVYCPTGKISEDENYVYGNEEGLQKYYFADGNLKAEENYFNGEKDGVSKYYYDNGKVEHIENWVLGSHHGKYYYYDKTGKLIRTAVYYNDDMIYESAQSETGTNKAQPKVQPKAPQPKAGGTGTHK
jgi:uncharacterized protein